MHLIKPGLVPDYPHPGTGPSAFPGGWSLSRSVPWVKVTQASIASHYAPPLLLSIPSLVTSIRLIGTDFSVIKLILDDWP